ncbi:MAG TPA: outer membrane beta-barrel protein [Longimicrobiaceae bacterium]|jgi:opacity protein-like surface antigen|nr:outer membrane beta-barrel protein [Longimicrobiaceae bacterium]
MHKLSRVFLSLALVGMAATQARAQQGFALKGHFLYNSNKVSRDSIPTKDGFDVGAEYVLPFGIGVGVTGYTTGKASEATHSATSYGVLAEANYFLKLPLIPLAPYAGVHAGLGRYTVEDLQSPSTPKFHDNRNQLGFQVGVRSQLTSMFGVDAQYRRVSQSAADNQDGRLSRNQVLVGITLF